MTDILRNDLDAGDTERGRLLDMAADYLASVWLRLKYSTPYRSARYVNGYVVEVSVREYRGAGDKPLRRVDEDDDIAD